jgi:hypothetical protein
VSCRQGSSGASDRCKKVRDRDQHGRQGRLARQHLSSSGCGAASNTRRCICARLRQRQRGLRFDRPIQPNRGRRSTYRRGKTVQTTETTSARLSNIIGIHKALRIIFREPSRGYAWMQSPNDAFQGRSALDVMLGGELTDIMRVRRYLEQSAAPGDQPGFGSLSPRPMERRTAHYWYIFPDDRFIRGHRRAGGLACSDFCRTEDKPPHRRNHRQFRLSAARPPRRWCRGFLSDVALHSR